MAAHVVEAADPPVLPAHRHHRLAEHFERVIVARLRNIVLVAHEVPGRAEDVLLLELEERGVVIEPRRQAECVVVPDVRGIH